MDINKMILQKAIDNLESYSNSKKKILSLLLELSEDNEAAVSAKSLIKMTGLTMPTVYTALKGLQKEEVIYKNPNSPNSFKFNVGKLEKIQSSYLKKMSIMGDLV